jgi:hypothetical protein
VTRATIEGGGAGTSVHRLQTDFFTRDVETMARALIRGEAVPDVVSNFQPVALELA